MERDKQSRIVNMVRERESQRERSRSNSIASSTGSCHGTITDSFHSSMFDFNPRRDEAFMSSNIFEPDTFTKLPELRASAKKYNRWSTSPPRRAEYNVNLVNASTAFADFSQGLSSEDNFSVELPRSYKSPARSEPTTEYASHIASSPTVSVTSGNTQAVYTPTKASGQKKDSSTMLKDALRTTWKRDIAPQHGSQKENIPPSQQGTTSVQNSPFLQYPAYSPSPVTSPYTSHASHTISGERKRLTELHARVADDDSSIITTPPKSRFSPKAARQQQQNVSVSRKPSEVQTPAPDTNPTTRSFQLPTIPEVTSSPLGVPVVAHDGKIQIRTQNGPAAKRTVHEKVDGIEVLDEEEDIYASVDELKARVAALEGDKAKDQQVIADHRRNLGRMELKMEKAKGDVEYLKEENHKLQQKINRLLEDKVGLKNEVNDLKSNTTEAERIIANLEDQIGEIQEQKQKMMKTNQELNSQIQKLTETSHKTQKTKEIYTETTVDLNTTTDRLAESQHNAIHPTTTTPTYNNAHNQTKQSAQQNSQRDAIDPTTTAPTRNNSHSQAQHDSQHNRPRLSDDAREVLDSLCNHHKKNCQVCARVISKAKTKRTIRKPVPASDRKRFPEEYEDEPTLRPSIHPGLALATVMTGIKDEIDNLTKDHIRFQGLYYRLDPSIQKTERKSAKTHLDVVLTEIDRKKDQLYALYDVLEGQKDAGLEMVDEEVEVTLLDLGMKF